MPSWCLMKFLVEKKNELIYISNQVSYKNVFQNTVLESNLLYNFKLHNCVETIYYTKFMRTNQKLKSSYSYKLE